MKKKHYHYFIPKIIDEAQVESIFFYYRAELIDRLKNGLIGDINEEMSNVDEEEFDFDYEDDFDVWRKNNGFNFNEKRDWFLIDFMRINDTN